MNKFESNDAEIYRRIVKISATQKIILEKLQAFLDRDTDAKLLKLQASQPKLSASNKQAKLSKSNNMNIADSKVQRNKGSANSNVRSNTKSRKTKMTYLQQLTLIMRKDKTSA
jgi:hypothetical protein